MELESSRTAYRADFAVYGLAVALLVLGLSAHISVEPNSRTSTQLLPALVLAGYTLWGLLEYLLHRFALHRMPYLRDMHAQHHLRPMARIGTPTVVSVPLFAALAFAPAWAVAGLWPACALMLGLLTGYLAYAVTHHACHHGRGRGAWLHTRRRWHARHHAQPERHGCFGVSYGLWDQVFGTARAPRSGRVSLRSERLAPKNMT
jgi:sterol desaturase/sphingolipid hydroxylase (fatty acid hydroxylase superfamily)